MKSKLFSKELWRGLSAKLSDSLNFQLGSSSRIIPFLLFFCCIGLNVYLRLFPAFLPSLKVDAALNTFNQYSEKFSKEVGDSQGDRALDVLEKVNEAIERNPEAFEKAAVQEYQKLKDPFQDEQGVTYLLEFDPYTWARWTENVVRNGHPGDRWVNGKSFDSLMLAPNGIEIFYFRFLFYLSAFLYRITNFFISALSVQAFLFFVPVFYAVCFLTIFYFFVRKWSTDIVAFFAIFLISFTGPCLYRGSAGWYDFDMLNLMMPLIISGCLLKAFSPEQSWGKRLFFVFSAAFFQGSFAVTWSGWPVIFSVMVVFIWATASFKLFPRDKASKEDERKFSPPLVCGGVFFILSLIFIYAFIGEHALKQVGWLAKYMRLGSSTSGGGEIWPNVLYTINELSPLSFSGIGQRFYGLLVFLPAVLSIPVVMIRDWKTKRREVDILMFVWFVAMAVATFKSNRFFIFLSIPLCYFFALFLGEIALALIKEKLNGLKRITGTLVYFILIGLLTQTVLKSGIAQAESIRPIMNDSWHDALVYVDKNTPQNSILNSWWDQGSWIRYYANRKVVFDGQSQYPPLVYWMARALIEKDEQKAIRILQMLDNSSYDVWYRLLKTITDPFRCEQVLEKLLDAKEEEARNILLVNGVSGKEAEAILKMLYATPAPAYLIMDDTLFGKMTSISFLGNWNFQRLYVRQNQKMSKEDLVAGLQKIYNDSPEAAEKVFDAETMAAQFKIGNESLSQRSHFYTEIVKNAKAGELVYFDYGLVFNPQTQDALLYLASEEKYVIPKKVILFEDGLKTEIERPDGNDDRVVLLVRQGNEYKSLVADQQLVDSLFVRLFFLKEDELDHFKPFYADEEHGIYIYQIDWDVQEK